MKLDEMEFGRRLAVERDLAERSIDSAKKENAAWDETGNFILYPSLVGIKGSSFTFFHHFIYLLVYSLHELLLIYCPALDYPRTQSSI